MSKFQPDGRHTVTPRIITRDVAGLVRFINTVFDAGGAYRADAPVEMTIGDSIVMVRIAVTVHIIDPISRPASRPSRPAITPPSCQLNALSP